MKSQKRARRQRVAHALDITVDELRVVREQVAAAESGLHDVRKAERPGRVARRLSITEPELKTLREALAGNGDNPSEAARLLARHVARLPRLRRSVESTPTDPKRPKNRPARAFRNGTPGTGGSPRPFTGWGPDTTVYITSWGTAIHLYADCPGTRGFRHANEPDPEVHQVRLRDPACRDRRACRRCFVTWSPSAGDRVDVLLDDLHGATSGRAAARKRKAKKAKGKQKQRQRGAADRPSLTVFGELEQRGPVQLTGAGATKPALTKKQRKARRDQVAAARLGITVPQLRERRRAEQRENERKKRQRERSKRA